MEERKPWCEECGSLGVRHRKVCSQYVPIGGVKSYVPETPNDVVEEEKPNKEWRVYNPNGGSLIRTYDERKLGKEAKRLAYGFAEKNNYRVV